MIAYPGKLQFVGPHVTPVFFSFTRLPPGYARQETQLKLSYLPIAVTGRD